MASEPTLVARMELRLTEFEKKLARATKSTDQTMRRIEKRGDEMTRRMQGIGAGAFAGLARGAALALGPILSVGAAINTAKAALSDFDAIAKSAKASGLSGEDFQELAYAAELGGVSTDQFAKALETFSKNAGLAAIGKGELAEKLKQLNPELLKNITATTDQATRVRLAADAINAAGSASEKAALAATLFGDAGVRMVEVFNGGAAALDATAKKARDLGLVIDNDLLRRAETMNDEFSTATKVMDVQFKQALIDLAPFLISTAQLAGNLASAIGYITDSMQELALRGTARLEEDLANIDSLLAQANANLSPGVVGTMGVQMDPEAAAKLQSERDAIFAELRRRAIDQLAIDLRTPDPDDSAGGGTNNAAAEAALKHGEAVKKLIADLTFERDILGKTALEQEVLNTLRNAGVDAASAEGQAIRGLITDMDAQKSAIERNAEAMEAMRDVADDALSGFLNDLAAGKDLGESFRNVLAGLGSQLLSMGVSGLTGALFPSTGGFGGFRANGGPVSPSKSYIVGERGPELFSPGTAGTIIPSPPPVRSMGGGGGVSVPINITIDAKGADSAGLARVQGQIAALQSELPGRVKQIVRQRGSHWR